MRQIINIGLILSFQLCYLEWPNNASFIFQAEYEIFTKTEQLIKNFMHPIILIGFASQAFILFAAIFKNFNSRLNFIGVISLTPIVLIFLAVGFISFNFKIIISTIPYMFFCFLYFKSLLSDKKEAKKMASLKES